jgi:hypothetical protein
VTNGIRKPPAYYVLLHCIHVYALTATHLGSGSGLRIGVLVAEIQIKLPLIYGAGNKQVD